MNILYIVVGVVVVVGLWLVATYNRFITLINRTKEAWADIDVQLKRRYDLIPNLVETVKGYVKHEAGTLEKVTAARVAAMEAGGKSTSDYYRLLASQRGIDAGGLTPYLNQLDRLNAKQAALGQTAGQTANALRSVPAQATDIVTSLAGGQSPLLVLLQQGGQLKDLFGGIGPAARYLCSTGPYYRGIQDGGQARFSAHNHIAFY